MYVRLAVTALALLVAGCTATVGEDSLLRPLAGRAVDAQALKAAAPVYTSSEHWIPAGDGVRLNALLLRQPGARATILYFGGNGYTSGQFAPMTARQFAALGVDLMIVDHRGYGRSEGKPTQANLEADGLVAFDYLTQILGVPPGQVIVHGHSLGSFIAGGVAARRPTGGAVLESSATTAEDWVDASHRGIARMLVRVKIDPALRGRGNLSNMGLIDEPLLILVGGKDRTTPPRLSQALYAASPLAPTRKTIAVIEPANHVDVMDRPETISAYRAWLARLGG